VSIFGWPAAGWFETRGVAALLTMRDLGPHPLMSAFALTREERALARVSKDEAAVRAAHPFEARCARTSGDNGEAVTRG
jgi:hypothetical protein